MYRRDTLLRNDLLDWALLGNRAPLVTTEEMLRPSVAGERVLDAGLRPLSGLACKAAARIASRLHRAVKIEMFSDLSLFGVRM